MKEKKSSFKFSSVKAESDTTILKKRSLMKHESTSAYNQLFTSTRAFEGARTTLIWLTKLREYTQDNGKELKLANLISKFKGIFKDIETIARDNMALTAEMEMELEKARKEIRHARFKNEAPDIVETLIGDLVNKTKAEIKEKEAAKKLKTDSESQLEG
jgi:hypothetical protein